jgi:hypothetical protein
MGSDVGTHCLGLVGEEPGASVRSHRPTVAVASKHRVDAEPVERAS